MSLLSSNAYLPPRSPSSKTAAFFASPPTSPTPPRSAELTVPDCLRPGSSSSTRSLTADFFSAPFASPPHSLRSVPSNSSLSDKSKNDFFYSPPPIIYVPPAASRTADFFGSVSSRPTPPPSLRSVSSNGSISSTMAQEDEGETPRVKAALPPLARMFPSRFRAEEDDASSLLAGSLSVVSPRRTFVELDEVTTSPTSSDFGFNSTMYPPPSPPLSTKRGIHHEDNLPSSDSSNSSTDSVYLSGDVIRDPESSHGAWELLSEIGQGAFSHVWKARSCVASASDRVGDRGADVVAVKVLARSQTSNKMHRAERAAFQREVDVLKHLSHLAAHKALPKLFAAFSREASDVLVLEFVSGGELLDLVNDDVAHAGLSESLLRRMWDELVGVVGWIHEHNVVHRDIKLENILLTSRFCSGEPLPPPDQPILKLMDFGLARAIDPADPWLHTRCGSETYAAPELLLANSTSSLDDEDLEDDSLKVYAHLSRAPTDGGKHRVSRIGAGGAKKSTPRREGVYDGRETDAWSLGVVLYALTTRSLPFDPPADLEDRLPRYAPAREKQRRESERRKWVRRVLDCQVDWPDMKIVGDKEVKGEELAGLESVRRIVSRLLVRDPSARANCAELEGMW